MATAIRIMAPAFPRSVAHRPIWFITDIAASMIQSQGTGQGTFFDTETFEPLVNNAALPDALWRSTMRPPLSVPQMS